MSRYAPNRTGYSGFTCVGYPVYSLPAMDCASNHYLNLPQNVERGRDSETFNTEIGSADTTDFYSRLKVLNFNSNPTTGDYVNLYKMLIDVGLSSLFTPHCYDQDQPCAEPEKYSVGSLNPMQPIIPYVNPIPNVRAQDFQICGVICEVDIQPKYIRFWECCCSGDGSSCTPTTIHKEIALSTCPTV